MFILMKKTILVVCVLLFSMSKSNAQLSKKLGALGSKGPKLEELLMDDDGISSALHERHIGEIVFCSEPLTKESSDSQFIKDYSLGEPLYMAGFFDSSIRNHSITNAYNGLQGKEEIKDFADGTVYDKGRLDFYHNGELVLGVEVNHFRMKNEATSFYLTLDDAKDGGYKQYIEDEFKQYLTQTNYASGQLKVVLVCSSSWRGNRGPVHTFDPEVIAEGILNIGEGEVPDESRCFPKAAKKDAALERQLVEALGWSKTEVLRVIIASADWNIIRNDLGVIQKKSMPAYIVYKKEGKLIHEYRTFERLYDGQSYGSIRSGGLGNETVIPGSCEEWLKKQ